MLSSRISNNNNDSDNGRSVRFVVKGKRLVCARFMVRLRLAWTLLQGSTGRAEESIALVVWEAGRGQIDECIVKIDAFCFDASHGIPTGMQYYMVRTAWPML